MKERIIGRVNGDMYQVIHPDGGIVSETPLDDARQDSKLLAAIERNGWEAIPEE